MREQVFLSRYKSEPSTAQPKSSTCYQYWCWDFSGAKTTSIKSIAPSLWLKTEKNWIFLKIRQFSLSILLSAFDCKQVWRLSLHQLGLLGSVMVSHGTLFYVNPFPARYCKCYCIFFGLDERWHSPKTPILSSLTQFSARWYLCAQKSPYALHPVSQKFPQHCLSNSSNVHLIDNGLLSSFQKRSSSASSFNASLLQAMSLEERRPWLCARRLCLKLLNTWDRPRSKPLVRVALPASLSAQSFKFGFNFSTCQHARRVRLQAWHYMALFRQSGRDLPCDVFQMAGKGLKGLGYVFHFTPSAFSMTDLT